MRLLCNSNELTTVPQCLNEFVMLERANFAHNKITDLPTSLDLMQDKLVTLGNPLA